MKFNEKLIHLRKQKGLSQEELGYKLNVTRQTVSKWELDETTPEMSKLVEMSKIFGVGLDELTNEEVKIEDKPINEKPIKNNSTVKVIILIVLITVIFLAAVWFLFVSHIFKIFNFGKDMTEKVLDKGFEMMDGMQNQMKETENKSDNNMVNTVTNMMNEVQNKIDTNFEETNSTIESQIEDDNFSEEYEKTKSYIEQQQKEILEKMQKNS